MTSFSKEESLKRDRVWGSEQAFERPAPAAQLSAVACGRAVRPFLRKEFFTTSGLSPSAPRQSHVATIGRLFLWVGFEQPAPAAQFSAVACGRLFLRVGFEQPARKYSRAGRRVSPRPALLIFSLVALPSPAPGGGRAPSPRPPPEAARFTSHNQNQKQQGAPRWRPLLFLYRAAKKDITVFS